MKKTSLVTTALVTLPILAGCNSIQLADITEAKSKNIPIITTGAYAQKPNSAGGIDVSISYASTSKDVIKYIVFEVLPYNKVGDITYSTIGHKSKARLRDVGPIDPEQLSNGNRWKNVWYNRSTSCVRIVGAEITYINGSLTRYNESNISEILTPDSENLCTYESQLSSASKKKK